MKYILIVFFSILLSNIVLADDTTVEMLNKLEKRSMVFSQEIVRIDSGDTVFWKSTDPGHNVQFIDVDTDSDLASKYGIRSVPTTVIEDNGVEINRIVGASSKQVILENLS